MVGAIPTRLRHSVVVNAEQTPSYGDIRLSGDEGGDFVFVPLSAKAVLEPATASASPGSASGPVRSPHGATTSFDADLAFWETVKDSDSPQDYAAYLKQFPEGVFAELAKSRMARASQAAAATPADVIPVEAPQGGAEPTLPASMFGQREDTGPRASRTGPAAWLVDADPDRLKQAILLHEVLGPPMALRNTGRPGTGRQGPSDQE